MERSTFKYEKKIWEVKIIEKRYTLEGAETGNTCPPDIVNIKPYKDKYPSFNVDDKTIKTISSFISISVKTVCFFGAMLGILKFFMSG